MGGREGYRIMGGRDGSERDRGQWEGWSAV